MKKILFSLIVISFAVAVSAQEASNVKAPALALRVSTFDFTTSRAIRVNSIGSVLNNRSWETLGNTTPSIGLQYFKGLTSKVDFMANLDFASLRYPFESTASVHAPADKKLYVGIDANVNFKMLSDDYKVVPYLTAGLGVATSAATYYTAYAPAGLGIQIKANHGSFININSTYRLKMSQLTQSHFNHGISYSLPLKLKVKKAIVIPPPPPPADTDNDGVNDEQDKCPTIAGLVKYNGCPVPDTDKDGVNDEQDKCPTVAGLVKYNGCPIPDTDKDGINDEQDKCPTTAGLSRYDGCPIPDTDKDGINDEVDKCPTESGIDANHGCPDVQPILTQAASNLKFATGKSYLSKKQLADLDVVVDVLNKYPNVSLDISGHTDNTGAEKINKKLSMNRATIVANYLVKKGIDVKRLSKNGYADKKPIADNKTKLGRSQNRRSEITAIYN